MDSKRVMDFKRVIPCLGKLEISVPADELINSISIDRTLNSPLKKTHELEVKLPRDYETLKLNLHCNILFILYDKL